jgi:hypothetical protein
MNVALSATDFNNGADNPIWQDLVNSAVDANWISEDQAESSYDLIITVKISHVA